MFKDFFRLMKNRTMQRRKIALPDSFSAYRQSVRI